MAKHRAELHEEHADESWLIPYADLLTLLLALFVVLYASSNVDQEKYNAMAEAFFDTIGVGQGFVTDPDNVFIPPYREEPNLSDGEGKEQENLENLQALLNQMLAEAGLEGQVSTSIDDRGLVISMSDAVLFDSGFADIKPQYREVMVRVGQTVNRLTNFIRIEGHTDTVPMNSAIFPTNWELSNGRATQVLRLFEEEANVDPKKLSAVGLGEHRPVAENSTVEGRAKNRRVDIIILSSRYNVLEEQHQF
jgi:chemotaxis protein MotB